MSRRLARLALLLVAAYSLIPGLLFLTGVKAQGPPLAISKTAQTEVAVLGEKLVYTLIVTNTGTHPVNEVIVRDHIPAGTTFVETRNYPPRWAAGGVEAGGSGDVFWVGVAPLMPQESVQFELVVLVQPDAQGTIVNDNYQTSVGVDGPPTTGPPVVVPVVEPTPTATVTPTPAPASPTPTLEPPAATGPETPSPPTPTASATPALSSPTVAPAAIEPPASTPAGPSSPEAGSGQTSPSRLPLVVGGLVVVAGLVSALAWVVRRGVLR